MTTPVDESANTAPSARPALMLNPKSAITATVTAMDTTICSTPVSRAVTPSRRSRDQLNSSPIVNIKSVTPRSAIAVISLLSISSSTLGPSSSPAPMKPTIALCLARSATDPSTMATASSTMMPRQHDDAQHRTPDVQGRGHLGRRRRGLGQEEQKIHAGWKVAGRLPGKRTASGLSDRLRHGGK